MWKVETFAGDPEYVGRYFVQREGSRKNEDFWPNVGVDPLRDFVDLGTATLMCDVFNARDYPGEALVGGPTNEFSERPLGD